MAKLGHFLIEKTWFLKGFIALDIIFKTVIIVISFNRAVKAQNNMRKTLSFRFHKRF